MGGDIAGRIVGSVQSEMCERSEKGLTGQWADQGLGGNDIQNVDHV